MNRVPPPTVFALALIVLFAFSGTALATTYYIAANGLDSNNGTSKTTPWLHAPGMNGCTGACAADSPKAGDQFVFRGGDTWHAKTGSPLGLQWVWTWSGSSGSPIYIGVDTTWYGGSVWARPVLNMDNPTSTSFVTSCAYDEYNFNAVTLNGVNYVTFDNFEFKGICWTQPPTYGGASYFIRTGTNILLSNSYFHGWTMEHVIPTSCCMDQGVMVGGSTTAGATFNSLVGNVFDGSDSPPNTGWALYADAYDVHDNVFRYISNALNSPGNMVTVHDNLFEYVTESFDPTTHSSVIEGNGAIANQPQYYYNNIFRYTTSGTVFWPTVATVEYVYNNVFFSNGNPGNTILLSPAKSGTTTAYFYNNTMDSPSQIRIFGGNSATPAWTGPAIFENNHLIGYSTQALSSIYTVDSGANPTITDNGNEVFQSEATANSEGYTPSNSYAPTSLSGATVGKGNNATTSCTADGTALCSGTSAGALENAEDVAMYPAIPVNSRCATGAWDAGAYEFISCSGLPNPPTGLAALVQ
jgi:hypothetical protein